MADLLPTDSLLVNRAGVDYSVPQSDVMATVQDTDLFLVNRAGTDYNATYADVKKGFGPQGINPAPGDWATGSAITGGTGTQADPFIVAAGTASPAGATIQSGEIGTLTGLKTNDLIQWTVNAGGNRFKQDIGIVPAGGTVSFDLKYVDTPASTTGQTYNGELQIGTTYFKWDVNQVIAAVNKPSIISPADNAGEMVQAVSDEIVDYVSETHKIVFSPEFSQGDGQVVYFQAPVDKTSSNFGLNSSLNYNYTIASATSCYIEFPYDFGVAGDVIEVFLYFGLSASPDSDLNPKLILDDASELIPTLPFVKATDDKARYATFPAIPAGRTCRKIEMTMSATQRGAWFGTMINGNSVITDASGNENIYKLTLSGSKDLTVFKALDDVQQDSGYTPTTSAITNVDSTNPAAVVLTLTDDTDLANFRVGDAVQQDNAAEAALPGASLAEPAGVSYTGGRSWADIGNSANWKTYWQNDTSMYKGTDITFTYSGAAPGSKIHFLAHYITNNTYNSRLTGVSGDVKETADDLKAQGPAAADPASWDGVPWQFVTLTKSSGTFTLHLAGPIYFYGFDTAAYGLMPSGTVGSVDTTANTMTLSTSIGTWSASTGNYVIGPATTPATGTVASTDPAANTITLSVSDETSPKRWIINQGKFVKGEETPSSDAAPNADSLTVQSSAFATTPPGALTQSESDWQITLKTDTSYASVVDSSMADAANLTSWTPTGLLAETAYRCRVKHRSGTVESVWSDDVTFKTAAESVLAAEPANWQLRKESDNTLILDVGTCTALTGTGRDGYYILDLAGDIYYVAGVSGAKAKVTVGGAAAGKTIVGVSCIWNGALSLVDKDGNMYTEQSPAVGGNSKNFSQETYTNITSMGLMSQNQTLFSCYTKKGNKFGVNGTCTYKANLTGASDTVGAKGTTVTLPCADGGSLKYAFITQYKSSDIVGLAWLTSKGSLYIAGSAGDSSGAAALKPTGGTLASPLDITPAGETVRFIASAPYATAGGIIATCTSGKVYGYSANAIAPWPAVARFSDPLPDLSSTFGSDNFCVMGDYRSRVILIKHDRIVWRHTNTSGVYNVTNTSKFSPDTDYLGAYLYSAMSNNTGIMVPTGGV